MTWTWLRVGDSIQLTGACAINVTSAVLEDGVYVMSFTLGALTSEQRETLALNGQSVSLVLDDMADQIEVGGTLDATECFSPISISATLIILSIPFWKAFRECSND
jgi:hypothetical protein